MPRYIIERNVGQLTDEEVEEAGRLSVKILNELPDVTWIRSYVSEAEGKIYCEYDAPNPDLIMEHARRGDFPADKISEIKIEINPDMFV